MSAHHIMFGNRRIDYQLEFADRKSLAIKVRPDGFVAVIAPSGSEFGKVQEKVRKKAPWIFKQQDRFASFKPGTPPRRFISGETHLYLGRQYRLKIIVDDARDVKAYRGQLIIHSPDTEKPPLERQLKHWYKEKAEKIFNELSEEVMPKFRRYNINQPPIVLRNMTTRWGSCTPAGRILLNTELIKAPKGCIEYVIIHELVHLIHRNHTKEFFRLLTRMLPDWQKRKDRLEYLMY